MKKGVIRMALAPVAMLLCVVVGFTVWSLWHGETGREYVPQGILAMILILLLAILLRRAAHWRGVDFLLGLLLAEVVIFIIICHFTGFVWGELLDSFNLGWLLSVSAFIAPPWILGFGLGSLWCWYSGKHAKRAA